tara:strand:+ start:183 stop:389 length:207 start_codon:yes stop_codon:yes gene_type:complete
LTCSLIFLNTSSTPPSISFDFQKDNSGISPLSNALIIFIVERLYLNLSSLFIDSRVVKLTVTALSETI